MQKCIITVCEKSLSVPETDGLEIWGFQKYQNHYFIINTYVLLCIYCFKFVDCEESIFGLFDCSGYDCSNVCMNKGISSAPGLAVHSCEQHWYNSVWLAHWSVHLIYLFPFLIFMLFFRLCVSFIIMLIGLVQLDWQLWRLVMSSSKGEGVEDVRCLNWAWFGVITAHFLTNEWMAWKANVWLNSRYKPTYYVCFEPANWILSRCKCVIQADFVLNKKMWSLVLHLLFKSVGIKGKYISI